MFTYRFVFVGRNLNVLSILNSILSFQDAMHSYLNFDSKWQGLFLLFQ